MAHSHHAHRASHAAKSRVKHILGHKRGGAAHHDEAADRKLFKKLIKEHDSKVHGHKGKGRLDKFARGGATKGKHHTQVNVIVAPHKGASPALGAGAPAGPGAPPPVPPPGGPPMAPPPGAGMPPMKRGGRTYKRGGGVGMTAGVDSGVGRIQQARILKRKH